MAISVQWDNNEQTIVRFEYEGNWDWEGFYKYIGEANEMMDTVPHPVVSIVDMSKTNHMPPNAIAHIRRIVDVSKEHNNSNISVFVGAGRFAEMLFSTLQKVYPDTKTIAGFHFVDTIEEARPLALKLQAEQAANS